MINLKTEISTRRGKSLDCEIQKKIRNLKGKKIFRGLGKSRPVFLAKYLETTNNRRDKTRRKQLFFIALELLKKAKKGDITNRFKEPTGENSFEIEGVTSSGLLVRAHIREVVEKKNRKLYLISTF